MNRQPKISVIVAVYNAEKYIKRCIDSLLAQTFTDFEVLLVNDGSTDNSGMLCDEYAKNDKRIKILKNFYDDLNFIISKISYFKISSRSSKRNWMRPFYY